MKIKYYNHSQATSICNAYQHLVGAPFESLQDDGNTVKAVIIAPYSRILQWKFVQILLQGVAPAEALAITPNDRYDVLVLPERIHDQEAGLLRIKSLRDYLHEHAIEPEQSVGRYLRKA